MKRILSAFGRALEVQSKRKICRLSLVPGSQNSRISKLVDICALAAFSIAEQRSLRRVASTPPLFVAVQARQGCSSWQNVSRTSGALSHR